MRRFGILIIQVLGLVLLARPAVADTISPQQAVEDTSDECDKRGGLTAIQRLPAVRIVVFDPVSNSFAFVTCPPSPQSGEETEENQDFLDRRRLALTTQKIRLLILPYDPGDGKLVLEKADGKGVEFQEIAAAAIPPAVAKEAAAKEEGKEQEQKPEETPQTPKVTNPKLRNTLANVAPRIQDEFERIDMLATPQEMSNAYRLAFEDARHEDGPAAALASLQEMAADHSHLAADVEERLQTLRTNQRCVRAGVDGAPLRFSGRLAGDEVSPTPPVFTLERDISLAEVHDEVVRRIKLISEEFYKPCRLDKDLEPGFESDVRTIEEAMRQAAIAIGRLEAVSREMERAIGSLGSQPPAGVSEDTWQSEVDRFDKYIAKTQDYNAGQRDQLAGIEKKVDALRADRAAFSKALHSPAMQLQRFNYEPLGDGQSVTFSIRRARPETDPGVEVPVNKLELKSAPVYTARFGMGLIASELENPTFKVADFPRSGSATEKDKVLLFDDRGNGGVVPGLFLHHYWGRKSPFLHRTPFEMWMPTLSLGIPVTQADLFTQFLVGLDWELTTGFELNVGYHFGKVNALIEKEGVEVGVPLPAGLDATSAQEKKFDSALYFGVVVNADAFTRIFKNGAQ